MLEFFKRLFGSKPAEPTPAPYKVETPVVNKPSEFPFPSKPAKSKAEKKPAAKAKLTRKPKAPKA